MVENRETISIRDRLHYEIFVPLKVPQIESNGFTANVVAVAVKETTSDGNGLVPGNHAFGGTRSHIE